MHEAATAQSKIGPNALQVQLRSVGACTEAVVWAAGFDDLAAAWAACGRGDWMLWLAGKCAGPAMGDGRKPLVLAACACARLSLKHVKKGEDRPLRAIELTERWARGEDSPSSPGSPITREELRNAYAAAADAAAAYAAAAYAAAYAADDAAAARVTTLKQCADIVRAHYPTPPVIGGGA